MIIFSQSSFCLHTYYEICTNAVSHYNETIFPTQYLLINIKDIQWNTGH